MKEIEVLVTQHEDWPKFCPLTTSTTDEAVEEELSKSVANCASNSFDTPVSLFADYDLNTITQDQIMNRINELQNNPEKWRFSQFFFDKQLNDGVGMKTRLTFKTGAPIRGYLSEVDDSVE